MSHVVVVVVVICGYFLHVRGCLTVTISATAVTTATPSSSLGILKKWRLFLSLLIPLLFGFAWFARRELPFITVVTDLGGAHPTWFNSEVDKVFIASDAVMRVAFREGLGAAQVKRYCRDCLTFLPLGREELLRVHKF